MKLDEKILEALNKAAPDKRLTCKDAWRLAEELDVSPRDIGNAADELKIKICDCQLGCF